MFNELLKIVRKQQLTASANIDRAIEPAGVNDD
jgi:hypothetical protein